MAFMFLKIANVSRGKSHNAIAKASYISRSKLVDERTGEVFDNSDRRDLVHSQLFTNSTVSNVPSWAMDRQSLWNQLEQVDRRVNARLAKELIISLPYELTDEQRFRAATKFADQLTSRYNCAADLAIHQPPPDGDPRNHHAHILLTNRSLNEAGFSSRSKLVEISASIENPKPMHYLKELQQLRLWWAQVANHEFKMAGLEGRLDSITPRYRAWMMEHRPNDHRLKIDYSEQSPSTAHQDSSAVIEQYWSYRRQAQQMDSTNANSHQKSHQRDLDYTL